MNWAGLCPSSVCKLCMAVYAMSAPQWSAMVQVAALEDFVLAQAELRVQCEACVWVTGVCKAGYHALAPAIKAGPC